MIILADAKLSLWNAEYKRAYSDREHSFMCLSNDPSSKHNGMKAGVYDNKIRIIHRELQKFSW